jgi:hypothetical protein
MSVPTPIKATGSHFYRYSNSDHLEWLKIIILEHELYLPSLSQLNDPADGRPKLAPMSEERMARFLINGAVERNPTWPLEQLEHEAAVIRYNVRLHGTEALLREMSELLNSELEGYRVYSLSKRPDNPALWAKYAGNHSGYCLEFRNEGLLFACAKEVTYGDATEMDVLNPEHRSGYWFFCKRQEWSNEEEVRLVLQRGKGSKVKIDPNWLTRLILGKDMADDHQKTIREWAKQRKPELAVVNAHYDELNQMLRLSEPSIDKLSQEK